MKHIVIDGDCIESIAAQYGIDDSDDIMNHPQNAALKKIRAGVNGHDAHDAVVQLFTSRGYETKKTAKGSVGFFHGTGHGLGLAVHEPPRVSAVDYRLKKGSVVTVEPGLYYPGLGGCRIEDVVQVTSTRPKMLSDCHYNWEIK